MINLNKHREKYINEKALDILILIKEMPPIEPNFDPLKGNKGEIPIIDIREKQIKAPIRFSSVTITGNPINIIEEFEDKTYGLDENSYNEFKNLVISILEEKTISRNISKAFATSKSLDWLFGKYRKEVNISFIDYLLPILKESIKDYKFTFRVLYLDIEATVNIGNCKIHYLIEKELQEQEIEFLNRYPNRKEDNSYQFLKKEFLGVSLISTISKGEYKKAKENAFKECSISIDTIKLCSITTSNPEFKLFFDIDKRVKFNSNNTSLSSPKEDNINLSFTISGGKQNYDLNPKEWESMIQLQIGQFHKFLKIRHKHNTDLCHLIQNSISLYAESITLLDLHKRTVSLFTILESLLLKSEDIPIVDSISKYLPHLVVKEASDRKDVISVVKKLYRVRSGMIHHAKKRKLKI